jgi:LysR family glycine cleavage system transcriptional activator
LGVRHLPPLNALRAFECAARHASFSLAGAELHVSHAAISRHVRDLEAWLGATLFKRTGRGVELTEDGQQLARELTRSLDIMSAAVTRFAPRRSKRQLVISAEVSFAALWLVPRLGSFTTAHPDVDLVLDPTNRIVDFGKDAVDIGLRYGDGEWDDVIAAKLVDSDLAPVCSPALFKKSKITSPRDLSRVTLLQEDPKQHWIDWLTAAGVSDDVQASGPTLKGHLAIAAAEAGQGFALADGIQAADALLAKRLVCPFDIAVRHHAYYLVRGTGKKQTKAASAFHAWLTAEIKQSNADLDRAGLGHLAGTAAA